MWPRLLQSRNSFHFQWNSLVLQPTDRRWRRRRRKQTHNNSSNFLTCTNRIMISESKELRNAHTYAMPTTACVCVCVRADFCPHVALITVISHHGSRDVNKREHFIFGIHENVVAVGRLLQLKFGSAPTNSSIDLMSIRMSPQNMCAKFRLLQYNVNSHQQTKRVWMLRAKKKKKNNVRKMRVLFRGNGNTHQIKHNSTLADPADSHWVVESSKIWIFFFFLEKSEKRWSRQSTETLASLSFSILRKNNYRSSASTFACINGR